MKPKCNNCGANALETYCTACGIIAEQPAPDAAPRPEFIEGLVEALRPFAACAELWDDDDAHRVLHWSRRNVPNQPDLKITVGDLLAARAALASVEGGAK